MRHHPSEYFIKYLCSHPGRTPGEVEKLLEDSGITILPYPEYVADIHEKLASGIPRNYAPRDRSHVPSRRFLKTEKILGMWHPSQAVRDAVKI